MIEWHLITGEYPPQTGGVSDHTRLIATKLASAGDRVRVWCPSLKVGEAEEVEQIKHETKETEQAKYAGDADVRGDVVVRRECGGFAPSDLRRVGRLLNQYPAPRRLLVQYVPHAYGYRSMNLAFCLWLWKRARFSGDEIEIILHEPFLEWRRGAWKQTGAAAVHRVMTATLLRAATRVWTTIPAWEPLWRPFTLGRRVSFEWLPVPNNIEVQDDVARVSAARRRYASRREHVVVGHLGTYPQHVADYLRRLLPTLLSRQPSAVVVLMGRQGERVRDEIASLHPSLAARVHATGYLAARELSAHLSACDLMLQPFTDGVSSRRTSVMAALEHARPVVTTAGRLTEALWAESGAVALAPADRLDALLEAVERLMADADARARLGEAGRALYYKHFDAAHAVAALRRVAVATERVASEALLMS